jgi:hypothetical protein
MAVNQPLDAKDRKMTLSNSVSGPGHLHLHGLPLQFADATTRLVGEARSKLLCTKSELYSHLQNCHMTLKTVYGRKMTGKRMDFHAELLCSSEKKQDRASGILLCTRAQSLQGSFIAVHDTCSYSILGNAIVLDTPLVESYGPTHITIAYFPNGPPQDALDVLKTILKRSGATEANRNSSSSSSSS